MSDKAVLALLSLAGAPDKPIVVRACPPGWSRQCEAVNADVLVELHGSPEGDSRAMARLPHALASERRAAAEQARRWVGCSKGTFRKSDL